MKVSKFAIRASSVAAVALFALACGSAAGPGSITNPVSTTTNQCAQGTVPGVGGQCVTPTAALYNFALACGGNLGAFDPNARTCTISVAPIIRMNYMGAYWPTLTRDNASGPTAINTGIPVKAGDVVNVAWVSGSYGSNPPNTSSYLGGLFTVTTWNSSSSCSEIDMNGTSNGAQGTYNGLNAGLVGGDGTNVYFLGTSGSATIATAGNLLLGINVPSSTQYLCGGFGATVTIKSN